MSTPTWNPNAQYYPPVKSPPIEWIAQAFLTPLLSPTPVATRLPPPQALSATLDGFVRVEAGDTVPIRSVWGAGYDSSFLMHVYSPNEAQAEDISTNAIGYVAAATGLTVVGWYIISVPTVIGGRRLYDPEVPANIVRYRCAVTWCIAGQSPAAGLGPVTPSGLVQPNVLAGETIDLTVVNLTYQFMLVTKDTSGAVVYDDCTNLVFADNPSWLSLANVQPGSAAAFLVQGVVSNPAWSWVVGTPVFLGTGGQLTQTLPLSARFSRQVAEVVDAQTIYFNPQSPVILG